MSDFTLREGDTASPITATLTDSDGDPVDIAGATIAFLMFPVSGGEAKFAAAATNNQNGDGSDGSKGTVSYQWVSGDTDTAGSFLASWTVTFAGGEIQTYPNNGYTLVTVSADAPIDTATRFADSDDLAARLGLVFTDDEHVRANTLLEIASGLIQDEAKQKIALVTDDVFTMPGTTEQLIKLPERPVVSVSSVTLDGAT